MEEEFEVIDRRQKPVEVEVSEYLISMGVTTLEQVTELFEPSPYAVIPLKILESTNLSPSAKLLYTEITALSKKSGICFATNKYLGERLALSGRTIPALLRELKADGLIEVDVDRSDNGTYRNIRVRYTAMWWVAKTQGGVSRKREDKREINKIDNNEVEISTSPPVEEKDTNESGYEVIECDEDGNAVTKKARKTRAPRNRVATALCHEFADMCKQELGSKPVQDVKAYKAALYGLKHLEEKQIRELFKDWFSSGRPDVDLPHITKALSGHNITNFKLEHGIK